MTDIYHWEPMPFLPQNLRWDPAREALDDAARELLGGQSAEPAPPPALRTAAAATAETWAPVSWGAVLAYDPERVRVKKFILAKALGRGMPPGLGVFAGDADVPDEPEEPWQHEVVIALAHGYLDLVERVHARLNELLPSLNLRGARHRGFDRRPYKHVRVLPAYSEEDRLLFLAVNPDIGLFELRVATSAMERSVVSSENLRDLLHYVAEHHYHQGPGDSLEQLQELSAKFRK